MVGIGKAERDMLITAVIKSNLVSDGLSSEQINKITLDLSRDIFDILENFDFLSDYEGDCDVD
jgi:hypothetical protein